MSALPFSQWARMIAICRSEAAGSGIFGAEHLTDPFIVVGPERVARGAQSDERLAFFAMGADDRHLLRGQIHPAREKDQEVGRLELLDVLQRLVLAQRGG